MTKSKKQITQDKKRNKSFCLQRVERALLDEVSLMAPRFRRSTGEMLNTVLAFGISKWKSAKACEDCLNMVERFNVKNSPCNCNGKV